MLPVVCHLRFLDFFLTFWDIWKSVPKEARLRSRRLTEMLSERVLVEEATDRWLMGSQSLLNKYTLQQEGPN